MLMVPGVYTGYVVALAWISNTLPRPPAKRAAALAAINAISNTSSIYASYMYKTSFGMSHLSPLPPILLTPFLLSFYSSQRHLLRCKLPRSPLHPRLQRQLRHGRNGHHRSYSSTDNTRAPEPQTRARDLR